MKQCAAYKHTHTPGPIIKFSFFWALLTDVEHVNFAVSTGAARLWPKRSSTRRSGCVLHHVPFGFQGFLHTASNIRRVLICKPTKHSFGNEGPLLLLGLSSASAA